MKQNFRYTLLLMLSLLVGTAVVASNKLSIADISGAMGARVTLPVYLTNSNSEIVAAQFRLTVPDGVTVDTESARPNANRAKNHTVVVQQNAGSYSVMLFSSNNSPIAGNSGQLLTIDLLVGTGFTPGGAYSLTLSDVIISSKEGENVGNDFSSAQLHIGEVTDFVVTDVKSGVTTVTPGDELPVSWTVSNQGGLAATGGWSEQVSLVGSNGRTQLLGTVYSDASALQAGATVSRQSVFVVPELPGMDGNVQVEVRLLPNADAGEMAEYQTNNTTRSATTVALGKHLTLTVPATATEGNLPLSCLLARSGDWTKAQTFNVSIAGDSRLTGPKQVTIAAGQSSAYFYLNLHDDALINQQSHFTITASGNGYDAVSAQMEVEDNEYPSLGLQVSKSTVTEGESFQLTVTTNRALSSSSKVLLSCEDNKRIILPASVEIPAGKTSVVVDALVNDDNELSQTLTLAIVATGDRFNSASTLVMINDNDMPELQLTLTPSSISESAGTNALIGTIKRLSHLDSKLTIKLSDNSNELISFTSSTLTLEKGVSETKFGMSVTDDLSVNGDREVTVSAAVYLASCSCQAEPQTGGYVSQAITVLDNDGPTLLVKPSATVFLEGSSNNYLTIERNASISTILKVDISSDYDEALTYSHTVEIPAGQSKAEVPIVVKSNDNQGDDKAFTFTVTAPGFTKGTCWSMVSDQSLPDAIITDFKVSASEAEAESEVSLTIEVKNTGNSLLRKGTPVSIYLGDKTSPITVNTEKILSAGQSTTISTTYTLPATTGDYVFQAVVNANKRISELLYTNNYSAERRIKIVPCLEATAKTDKKVYRQGESVKISGKATGTKASNAKIEIYLINDGIRQTITANTDNEGNYKTTWVPQQGLAGHFGLGACYPGEELSEIMNEFDVYGLTTHTYRSNCQFGEGETYTGKITITNPGVLPQTGIRIEPQATSDNCDFTFQSSDKLEGGETASLSFTIKGNSVTQGYSWQQMPVVVRSNEGSSLEYRILYYIDSQYGRLRAESTHIKTTMMMNEPRTYPFTIQNTGKGETGTITLALPSWIETVTPRKIASLASGDSTTIMLRFVPNSEMRVNVPITGHFGINCSNGPGLMVTFEVTPVSESKGTLIVDVVDEFTYYTTEAPHVSNAKVQIKNMATGQIVREGTTDAKGLFSAEMNEGWYELSVEAENHESATQEIMVDPGKDHKEEVYLSYDAITYDWNVVETTVDDEYSIETIVKFDTRVPEPVVIVSWPKDRPEPGSIFPVTVTNKGFINAKDVEVDLSVTGNYELEFLNDPSTEVLAPQQSVIFYAKVKLKNAEGRRKAITPVLVDCFEVDGGAWFKYDCGPHAKVRFVEVFQQWGHCPGNHHYESHGGGSSYSGWSDPWHHYWGGNDTSYYQPDPAPKTICQEKDETEEESSEEIPHEDPEENENCEDEPHFEYVMAPFGTNHPTTSIPADGKTYEIYLNPFVSKIPPIGCNYGCKGWSISSDSYGTLGNYNSFRQIYYTAPIDLPEEVGESAIVAVTMTYIDEKGNEHEVPFTFELHRQALKFKLEAINADGNNLGGKWRGVAADGVSKLMIKLDDTSKDHDNLGNVFTWHLSEQIGHLEDNEGKQIDGVPLFSLDEVTYIPPTDYPEWIKEGEHTIKAVLDYGQIGKQTGKAEIEIVISRVPLVLLHGFASDASAWQLFSHNLTSFFKYYFTYQIDNSGYKNTNCAYFEENKGVLQGKIRKIINRYSDKRIYVNNVDVIGHSMGGILARMHVQDDMYKTESNSNVNIHKLITVNTPHMGSEIANWIMNGFVIKNLIDHIGVKEFKSTNAIKDLAVGSDALKKLNSNDKVAKTKGIPIHTISSNVDNKIWTLGEGGLLYITDLAGKMLPLKTPWPIKVLRVLNEFENASDIAVDLYESDMVVSKHSQHGGLYSPFNEHYSGSYNIPSLGGINDRVMHTQITENLKLHNHLIELLKAPCSNGRFSYSGFGLSSENARRFIKSTYNKANEQPVLVERDLDIEMTHENDSLRVNIRGLLDNCNHTISFVDMGDYSVIANGKTFIVPISPYYEGMINVTTLAQLSDGGYIIGKDSTEKVSINLKPKSIECSGPIDAHLGDRVPIYLMCKWNQEDSTFVSPETVETPNKLVKLLNNELITLKVGIDTLKFSYKGLSCACPIIVYGDEENNDEEDSNSVCSTVSLKIEQKAVMTRQAFRGTLTVNNGHPTKPITDLKVNIEVRNANGILATAHEFQIEPEALDGFIGKKDFNDGWTLDGKESGTATILFIPTKYAAPTEPQEWSFGGSFSYTDPYTDLTVTRDLNPVTLTVNPTPVLDFTYFMQRDVLGDDPLTEAIEPMEPAEFAIIVNNKGYGSTQNMKMTTNQPQIIDNEKGLAVNFEIISTQMNGQEKTMALGQSMTTDFGTIEPQSQAYAQWWLQSSLLGHFVEYDIKATHVTSHDNPDLSLLDQVTIHELIHGFTNRTGNGMTRRGFLVNDIEDNEDLPDEVYFTDATQQGVKLCSNAQMTKRSNTEYALTMSPSESGWYYGVLNDPTCGQARLTNIVRSSDGATIDIDNVWQTDRTLRDGKDPLYEYRLHFVADLSKGAETYLLTFQPKPNVELAVDTIIGIPNEGTLLTDPLKQVTVKFNKAIEASTFTTNALTIKCQANQVSTESVGIKIVDDKTFLLDLSETTLQDGFYVLTIQTSGIKDAEGFNGSTGKQAIWTQCSGKLVWKTQILPEDAGTVTPRQGLADYGTQVVITAIANEGYEFSYWSKGDEIVSEQPTYELTVLKNDTLKAVFTPKTYYVTINYDENKGIVEGGGTGFYSYGQDIKLTAKAYENWLLEGWYVNDVLTSNTRIFTVKINGETTIEPRFIDYTMGDVNHDGQVGIGDIVAVTNVMAGISRDPETVARADVSGDGEVGIGDIVAITNIMAGNAD